MEDYSYEDLLDRIEADLAAATEARGDPSDSVASFEDYLDLALSEDPSDSVVLGQKGRTAPNVGPLGALGLGIFDNPISRTVTRPFMYGMEHLERAIADIRGADREPRDIPPMSEPLVSTDEMTSLERNWQIAGEVLAPGAVMAKGPGAAGRAVISSVRGTGVATKSHFDIVRAARAARKDPSIPAGLKPSSSTAGGAYPEWLFPVMETATTDPYRYAIIEGGSLLGAAQGAAIMQELRPEDPVARMAGEVVGGFANPAVLGYKAISNSSGALKSMLTSFTKAGRQASVGSMYTKLLREAGEDVDDIILSLERGIEVPVDNLTAGQITNSPTMLAIENKIAGRSAEYAGRRKDDTKKALQSLRQLADGLASTGNPSDLRNASIVRRTYFEDIMRSSMSDARQRVLASVRAAMPSGNIMSPGDLNRLRGDSSKKVRDILYDSLLQARKMQTELWDQIPTDVPMPPARNLREAMDVVGRDMPAEISLPFQKTLDRLSSNVGWELTGEWTSTSGDFVGLAKDLSSEARRLRAAEDFRGAWIARTLREAVLEDLAESPIPGTSYQAARDFTVVMKDVFNRSFVGDALATNVRGADRISPEDMLDIAFNPKSALARDRRLREMVDVGEFFNQLYGFDTEIGSSILFEQETYLRTLANRFVDREGNVDFEKLVSFVDHNQNIIERFPQLQKHLSDVESAARYLDKVEKSAQYVSREVLGRAAFSNLTGAETPITVVRQVLDGPNPFRGYRSMARTARDADRLIQKTGTESVSSSKAALDGLKASTLDYAFAKSSNVNGTSFVRLHQELDTPIARGKPSIIEMMVGEGVMTSKEASNLREIVSVGVQAERALKDPHRLDDLIGEQKSPLWDAVVSIVGARAATHAAGQGGMSGSGIIIAGRGASLARSLASDMPTERFVDVIIEMSRNPKMLATAMKTPKSAKERIEITKRLNAYLINAGLPKSSFLEESDIPELWSPENEDSEVGYSPEHELEAYLQSL